MESRETFASQEAAPTPYISNKSMHEKPKQGIEEFETLPSSVNSSNDREHRVVSEVYPKPDSHMSPGQTRRRSKPGLRRMKGGKWGAVIRNPFTKRQVWLGTYDSEEAASHAYNSMKLEFQKAKQGIEKEVETSPSGFHDPDPDPVPGLCMDEGQNPRSLNRGLRKMNNGKWGAVIGDPVLRRQVWLGTFHSKEAAWIAYHHKKLEFEKTKRVKKQIKTSKKTACPVPLTDPAKKPVLDPHSDSDSGRNLVSQPVSPTDLVHKPESPAGPNPKPDSGTGPDPQHASSKGPNPLPKSITGPDLLPESITGPDLLPESITGPDLLPESITGPDVLPEPIKGPDPLRHCPTDSNLGMGHRMRATNPGVRKEIGGKWGAVINNPFTGRRVWLGMFNTEEAASCAYLSKKQDFERIAKAKQRLENEKKQNPIITEPEKTAVSDPGPGTNRTSEEEASQAYESKKTEDFKHGESEIEESKMISSAEVNPMTKKSIYMGTFQTQEEDKLETYHQSQKIEFEESRVVEDEDDGGMWLGKWVPMADGREVSFSVKYGVPIVDNYGYLLGEFQRLDDELWICKEEDYAHQA
ncbi:unnamed protein product [Cuscuta epithymum]|uniref:AP2/ERF domain-containing protein n=1 Tax=Cuscuta epithymum TaxID=186058 RepID=A0AAV0DML7_9ASTE|nr:unnamed protein product [Cuscuta epithymum]